jgi:methyl-accepting chemotaxis protein
MESTMAILGRLKITTISFSCNTVLAAMAVACAVVPMQSAIQANVQTQELDRRIIPGIAEWSALKSLMIAVRISSVKTLVPLSDEPRVERDEDGQADCRNRPAHRHPARPGSRR